MKLEKIIVEKKFKLPEELPDKEESWEKVLAQLEKKGYHPGQKGFHCSCNESSFWNKYKGCFDIMVGTMSDTDNNYSITTSDRELIEALEQVEI